MSQSSGERQTSLSSDKLLSILECLASNRVPMRLQDISAQCAITQPTVLRYIRTLLNTNYVYQDTDTSRYALTWKLCKLTEDLNSSWSLRNIVNPFVGALATSLQMGVSLVTVHENQIIYLDYVDHPHALYPLQYIGKQAPLHAVASGKLLLTTYSERQLNDLIDEVGLEKLTPQTITNRDDLLRELDLIKKRGYSIDNEECEPGMSCIAYPLLDYTGNICASLAVIANSEEMKNEKTKKKVCLELENTTKEISRRLGYSASENM